VDLVIFIAGVAGLAVAGYAFVSVVVDAVRARQYLDIAIAAAVAMAVVYALVVWGDRLIR
jgi:hypothetical protein